MWTQPPHPYALGAYIAAVCAIVDTVAASPFAELGDLGNQRCTRGDLRRVFRNDARRDGPPRMPPPLVGEALDTDALIVKLPKPQQDAIRARFLWTVPETLQERAAALGIHPTSFSNRIKQACYRLENMHQARLRACAARTPVGRAAI